ncbi:MAG: hypothetical protein F6J93_33960 [Oscillatoria sp. SIO1A7]|nr:hypothetical protein [Oscillatoria sp. SIO1A7]
MKEGRDGETRGARGDKGGTLLNPTDSFPLLPSPSPSFPLSPHPTLPTLPTPHIPTKKT